MITTFFVNTTAPQHLCGQSLSPCPQLHVARRWASTVHASVKRKKLDNTYTDLSFCLQRLLLSSVWPSLQCGCQWIQYKKVNGFGRRSLQIWQATFAHFPEVLKRTKSSHLQQGFNTLFQTVHMFTSYCMRTRTHDHAAISEHSHTHNNTKFS